MKDRQIHLWFGTLKIKHRERLTYEERHGRVPVIALGKNRLTWWSNSAKDRLQASSPRTRRDTAGANGL